MGFVSPFQTKAKENERQEKNTNQTKQRIETVTTANDFVNGNGAQYTYWRCLYAKKKSSNVKRKTLKFSDGALKVNVHSNETVLFDEKGVRKAQAKPGTICAGTECAIGLWEIEVDCEIASEEFINGNMFAMIDTGSVSVGVDEKENKKMKTATANKPFQHVGGLKAVSINSAITTTSGTAASNTNRNVTTAFAQKRLNPVYEITETSVVFYDGAKKDTIGPIPIVCDPNLAKHLRPHQIRGVKFMLESCLNITSVTHAGCLLSHDVGLGKTLQVIALIWTLLNQSPKPSNDVHRDIRNTIQKVIVAVPATLVGNWKQEFKKWLDLKIDVEAIDGSNTTDAIKKQLLRDWALDNQKRKLVLIASYETLRANAHLLENKAQLLICDEAHRLKAKDGSKTLDGLKKINAKMRVLLSGTAIQNNLAEFYSLMDFANPGILSDYATFRKVYQQPAEKANDAKATKDEKLIGKARAQAIFEKTAIFIDRCAKSDVDIKGLPPKVEFCLFLSMSESQQKAYKSVCDAVITKKLNTPLVAVSVLQKVCNGIAMLKDSKSLDEDGLSKSKELRIAIDASTLAPSDAIADDDAMSTSVKLRVLAKIVEEAEKIGDRVVVVSGWTSTLDVIENALLCTPEGGKKVFTRLDGGTPSHKRTGLVTAFNKGFGGSVFLLSRKAGGVGLNLIGANRLVLYDCDWNPANDLQATARIHRDGQMKISFIYRFLTSFTLEEKIFQRQCQKGALARSMGFANVEADATENPEDSDPKTFSSDELRKLFKFDYVRKVASKEPCEMATVESFKSWMIDVRDSGTLNDDVLEEIERNGNEMGDIRFYAKLSG